MIQNKFVTKRVSIYKQWINIKNEKYERTNKLGEKIRVMGKERTMMLGPSHYPISIYIFL